MEVILFDFKVTVYIFFDVHFLYANIYFSKDFKDPNTSVKLHEFKAVRLA